MLFGTQPAPSITSSLITTINMLIWVFFRSIKRRIESVLPLKRCAYLPLFVLNLKDRA